MKDESDIKPVENREILTPEGASYMDMVMPKLEKGTEYVQEKGVPATIKYYCRDCKKEVSVKRVAGKLSFKCKECESEKVSFGIQDSIQNYYKLVNSKSKDKTEA